LLLAEALVELQILAQAEAEEEQEVLELDLYQLLQETLM
jgi:hypothetical protein